MANEKNIRGNLRLRLNGRVIFDSTSCTISLSRETTQRTGTKDSAAGASTKGTKSWTVSYNGLGVYAGDGTGGRQFKDLIDYWNDDSTDVLLVEMIPEESDHTWYYKGDGGIITQLDGVFNFSEDSTISMTVTGTGDFLPVDKNVTAPSAPVDPS